MLLMIDLAADRIRVTPPLVNGHSTQEVVCPVILARIPTQRTTCPERWEPNWHHP